MVVVFGRGVQVVFLKGEGRCNPGRTLGSVTTLDTMPLGCSRVSQGKHICNVYIATYIDSDIVVGALESGRR